MSKFAWLPFPTLPDNPRSRLVSHRRMRLQELMILSSTTSFGWLGHLPAIRFWRQWPWACRSTANETTDVCGIYIGLTGRIASPTEGSVFRNGQTSWMCWRGLTGQHSAWHTSSSYTNTA